MLNNCSCDIKIDNLTKEKCALIKYGITEVVTDKKVIISIPKGSISEPLPMNLSLGAQIDNKVLLCEKNKLENEIVIIKGVWIFIDKYVDSNAGHVLGDEVFAIWQALTCFELENQKDINIVTTNEGPHIQQYECLTNKVYSFKKIKKKLKKLKNKDVCFEKLIVGMSRNGYAQGHQLSEHRSLDARASYLPPFINVVTSFQKHCYKQFNIDTSLNHKRSIIILDKDDINSEHKCKLYDIDLLLELIKKNHSSFSVKKINWSSMKMSDQVKEMVMADIVISLPGSDLMNCIFLDTKSTIIVPHRFDNYNNQECSNEIDIWFQFTHKIINIKDVSIIRENGRLYSKINNIDMLLKHVKNAL